MRAFGHPLHPAVVHFPIALLGTSLVFDLVGVFRDEPIWWTISFWNLALGLVAAGVAAITGLADSMGIWGDPPATKIVTRHLIVVVSAVCCYGAALVVRQGPHAPEGTALAGSLALEALGLGLLLVGGWLGGELVYGGSSTEPAPQDAPHPNASR